MFEVKDGILDITTLGDIFPDGSWYLVVGIGDQFKVIAKEEDGKKHRQVKNRKIWTNRADAQYKLVEQFANVLVFEKYNPENATAVIIPEIVKIGEKFIDPVKIGSKPSETDFSNLSENVIEIAKKIENIADNAESGAISKNVLNTVKAYESVAKIYCLARQLKDTEPKPILPEDGKIEVEFIN